MDTDNQENYDDPQFVKVLETCLKMEIAEGKKKMDGKQSVAVVFHVMRYANPFFMQFFLSFDFCLYYC